MKNPTSELYGAMQMLYEHFNKDLFNGELPDILFTNQRQNGVMGYFSPNRWGSHEGKHCHELAINPTYVGRATLIELMQTLVHEMAHCWQECFGKPSRRGYHNKEWADKMVAIGLMPSSTGKPGGAMVGTKMSDYPAPKGKFIYSCERLLREKNFTLPWVDRFAMTIGRPNDVEQLVNGLSLTNGNELPEELEALHDIQDVVSVAQLTTPMEVSFGTELFVQPDPNANIKVKSKYSCPDCKLNVWGRSKLRLSCLECSSELIES